MSELGPVDVLVIAAMPDELGALLEVEPGAGEMWVKIADDPPYHVAKLKADNGPIVVAAARPTDTAGVPTASLASALIERLAPRHLAMCGVCAGRPGDTDLGDVIIASRVFQHDFGKLVPDGFRGDLTTHVPDDRWVRVAQDLCGPAKGLFGYAPAPDDAGPWWLLDQLRCDRNPLSDALDRYLSGDRYTQVLTELLDNLGHVRLDGERLVLTDAGREAINRHRIVHRKPPAERPYFVHSGPIGSGNAVRADGQIWVQLNDQGQRKTLGIEQEAAAVGRVAHERRLPFVVAKGVMDHADTHKADGAKAFAARASAEVLCHFLRQVVVPAKAVVAKPKKMAPTRLPAGAPKLFGRDEDLAWLDRAWAGGANVATIVAWGGVGKTALVHEWRTRLLAREGGVACVFDWSFYSQGARERGAVSADNFIREALRFCGDVELAESNASAWAKGARLAELVGGQRSLLILDGLEPLQDPKLGVLKEGSIEALLKRLAASNQGLCVVTTRVAVQDLQRFEGSTALRLPLEHLSDQAGAALLQSLLEDGSGPKRVVSTQAEREEISKAVRGHALTLQLLGGYIRRALGDIRRWTEIDFSARTRNMVGMRFG